MIAANIWNPAMLMARAQAIGDRTDCARAGMIQLIQGFFAASRTRFTNRRLDGLTPIDQAANALVAAWPGGAPANDGAVTAVLTGCAAWLTGRRVAGLRITGWREASIANLYWQTAWCYSCDHYVRQAIQAIGVNNGAGHATTLEGPVPWGNLVGNPYRFVNCGYVHQNVQNLLRGDSRGPISIHNANGFQPRTLAYGQYAPWWDGHNTSTPSATTDERLAINAALAALAVGGAPGGPLPAWLAGRVAAVAPNGVNVRSFVYAFGNLGAAESTRLAGTGVGREQVFLALPRGAIARWWAVLTDRHTVGPFFFDLAAVGGLAGYSANPLELA